MKNELPKNWVIDTQAEKDSPLMPKFMEWFEKNRTDYSTGHFYGKFNVLRISRWDNSEEQTIITLEQWNAFYFPEWEPKQGEIILVRISIDDMYEQRVFVVKHNGSYYCENTHNSSKLTEWTYAKPIPKQSILQPLVDQLKAEAKKLGIKDVKSLFNED